MQTVTLSNSLGSIEVETFGARLVSYIPARGNEVFARLSDGSGGLPLCWPWFSGNGPEGCRRHGLARYCEFSVVRRLESSEAAELEMRLDSNTETHRYFDFDFRLTVCFRLANELTVVMTGENTGDRPFSVTEMLHPYFAVSDVSTCRVKGLGESGIGVGPRLVDLPVAAVHDYSLVDSAWSREIAFASSGDRTAVVWNPGGDVATSPTMTSVLSQDEWRRFVCVENGTARPESAYVLHSGARHTLLRSIRVRHLGS